MTLGIIRKISIGLRKKSEQKKAAQVLAQAKLWASSIDQLPMPKVEEPKKKLALIRLDDIGDYILWRNVLVFIRNAAKYKGYEITLIGNIVWKELFDNWDYAYCDQSIWVDKKQYFSNESYRMQIWTQIRNEAFEQVVCPSRSRPLLLDDMCCKATAAKQNIACTNQFPYEEWNTYSNAQYQTLFQAQLLGHEFYFNKMFCSFHTHEVVALERPMLALPQKKKIEGNTIICFIGASAKSKRWPLSYWINCIKILQKHQFNIVVLGGPSERDMAQKITEATGVVQYAGKCSLIESFQLIQDADLVISGDSMAAHAAVALQKKCIILANGVNAKRFVQYQEYGFNYVRTLYTSAYIKAQKPNLFQAVSSDMKSISITQVVQSSLELLR